MQMIDNYQVIDFETKDYGISNGMGGGWLYNIVSPDLRGIKHVSVGNYCSVDDEYSYHTNTKEFILNNQTLVAHNLIYDLGCYVADHNNNDAEGAKKQLRDMFKKDVLLVDTRILARLVDEFQMSYSLKNLAKKYKVHQKSEHLLADAVFNTGLYTEIKSTNERKFVNRPSNDNVLLKMAYQNMDRLPEDIVKEYCLDDVKATKELYEVLMTKLLEEYSQGELDVILNRYSTLQYCVMEMRINGLTIDNNRLHQNHSKLCEMLSKAKEDLNAMVALEVNVSATASLVEAFKAYGYDEDKIPKTAAGNPSITQKYLEDQNNDLSNQILRVRKITKILGTFIEGMMEIQDHLSLSLQEEGAIFGEFNIFGTHTGRFSSSNPNIQQIPKRDPEFYEICRQLFIAGKGRKFISADYSNQEQRIQIHYGSLLGAKGADKLAKAWSDDPLLDFHQKVADIVGIGRTEAKTINLGKSYGMGEAKLCHSLGLPTELQMRRYGKELKEMEVAGTKGKDIIDRYNQLFPFISQATTICRNVMQQRGYIKSLGGRHIHSERIMENGKPKLKYFKAFNQLIQGSAADQLIKTMCDYYKDIAHNDDLDVKLVGVVHDEMLFTVPKEEVEASKERIDTWMCDAFKLEVPMVADIEVGNSWYADEENSDVESEG